MTYAPRCTLRRKEPSKMLNRIKALRITAAYKEAKEKALTGSTQSRNGTYEALETTHLANRRAG